MGDLDRPRQSQGAKENQVTALDPTVPPSDKALVAFDFDGTLTVRDSFMAFIAWRSGAPRFLLGMIQLIPAALAYLIHRDRGLIKMAAVRIFLGGLDRKTLEASADGFARAASGMLFRPDALAAWNGWGTQGATRVICTASPEILIAPFAKRLGAEDLIGTRLEFDDQDRVTGRFIGLNCRAAEKIARLKQAYGPDLKLTAAYGDTSGDTEMLAAAERKGYRVFTQKP
jgi:phosphatidylglycerophosphatase C